MITRMSNYSSYQEGLEQAAHLKFLESRFHWRLNPFGTHLNIVCCSEARNVFCMAGKSNSQQSNFLVRGYQYLANSGSSKVYDNTSKNDTVTSQQPSNTASKPKDSIRGATKPIPGAVHDQPLSSTPQRPTKVLYLNSSGLVTEHTNNLGHGSFGRVYAGTYDGSNCAVKVFEANTKLQKIEKEAEVSFLLTHNNLVQVYGLCRKDNKDCLVMERCTMNLTAYLERQRRGHQLQYTVKLKLSILHQITQGMLYLHLNEIVHGDLSPGNVLLQLEGPAESPSTFIVKIADFGQSRLLNTNKNKQLTSTHGKDHFMPPEVLNASKEKYPISKSVDLFSFGCLVPYIATCMYPDPTVQAVQGSSELQKRIRHIKNCIPVLEPPEFKAACEDLMTKCLHSKPGDRPSFQHISAVLGPHVKIYVDQGYSATEEEKITENVKLNEELQSKKDWCDQLQEEKDKIKRDYDVSQRDYQDLETKCQDKTKKIDELQKEMNSLQMQVVTNEASLKAYSGLHIDSVVGDSLKLQKERDDAVRRMEYAKERNAELKVQCQGLQEQVDDLKCELNQTTSMKTNLEQKKIELAGEKNSLQDKLQIVEKALETSSLQCAQLQKKVSQLNSELLTTTTSRNEFQTSCQTLENKKKELESSSLTTKYELAASKKKVKEHEVTISGQLAKLQNKAQKLHSETSAKILAEGSATKLNTQCKKQEVELVRLKKEVAQLEAKKSELVNNLSAETEAKEALQKNVKKLEEENIKAEKEIGRMTNIVDYVKKESKTKDEEYKKLNRQYKEVVKDGKENIQLTEKLKDAEASHEKAMAMHHTATKEKEELSRKVEELERKKVELTKTVASNEVEIKEKQEEIESLKVSHEKSCDENSTLDTEKKRLTEELAAAETDRDALIESEANNKTIIRSKTQTNNQQFAQLDSVMEERKELEMMNTRAEAFLQQCDKQCESMKKDLEELRGMLEKARKTEELTSQWTEIKDQTIKEFNERNMFLQRECHRLEKEALSRHAETVSKSELQVQQLKQEHEHLKATHSQCEELGRKKRSLDKQEKKIQRQKEANMKEVVQILRKDQMAANNLGDTSFSKESLVFYDQLTDQNTKFEHEARISVLCHPHIVKVHGLCRISTSDQDSNKPQVALVMDLCDRNLAAYLTEKLKPNSHYQLVNKLMILQQVTEAIIYLHDKRIVHGDLSAANILMGNSPKQPPNVKIADFGQARVLNPDTLKHQTNTRGRDDIMPPEIFDSSTDVIELTKSVDLFSFGCLVPYVATCKYPTPAEVGSAFEKRIHHLNSLAEVQRHIFEGIMMKCLDERPHWRGTFEEVHERLAPEVNKYVAKSYPISMEEQTAEIQKLKGEVQRQQQQVGELKESLSCSEVKCTRLQDENKSLTTSNSLIHKDLIDSQKTVQHQQTELAEKAQSIKTLNGQLAVAESAVKNVGGLTQIFKDSAELAVEKDRLEKENKTFKEQCADKERIIEEQQSLNDQLKSWYTSLEKDKKEKETNINELTDLKKKLVFELATQKGRVETLQGKIQSLETQTQDLEAKLRTFTQQKQKVDSALAHSEKERTELTQKLTSSSATVQSGRTERETLLSSVHDLNTKIRKLTSAKQTLENRLAESQESEQKLKEAAKETRKDLSQWKSTADTKENGEARMKTKIKDLQGEVRTLKDSHGKATFRANKAEGSLSTTKTSQKELNQQLTDLRSLHGTLQVQFNSATTERDDLKRRNLVLKGQVETLERQVKGLKMDLELQKEVALNNMRECNEVKLLLEKAKEEGGLAEEREKQLEDFKRKLEDSKKGHSKTTTALNTEQTKTADLTQQVESLQNDFTGKDEVLQQKEGKIQWLEDKVVTLARNIIKVSKEKQEEVEISEELFDSLLSQVSDNENKTEQFVQSWKSALRKGTDLDKRIDKEVADHEAKLAELSQQLEKTQETLRTTEEDLIDAKMELDSYEVALQNSATVQDKLEELMQAHASHTKVTVRDLRERLKKVQTALSQRKKSTVQMNRQHLQKMAAVQSKGQAQLKESKAMSNFVVDLRQSVVTFCSMVQSSFSKLIPAVKGLKSDLKASQISQLQALMDKVDLKEECDEYIAQYKAKCSVQEADLKAVTKALQEKAYKLQDSEGKLSVLTHAHSKCLDLTKRAKRVKAKESKLSERETHLERERLEVQARKEGLQDASRQVKLHMQQWKLTPAQITTITDGMRQAFRNYSPAGHDSSSSEELSTSGEGMDESLAQYASWGKQHLCMFLDEKIQLVEQLKAANADLDATVRLQKMDLKKAIRAEEEGKRRFSDAKAEVDQQRVLRFTGQLQQWRDCYFSVQCYPLLLHSLLCRGVHLSQADPRHLGVDVSAARTPTKVGPFDRRCGHTAVGEVEEAITMCTDQLFDAIRQRATATQGSGLNLSLSISLFWFGEFVTLHRFHIVVTSAALQWDARIHGHSPDSGGVIPNVYYAHSSIPNIPTKCVDRIKGSTVGVYYATHFSGQREEFKRIHPRLQERKDPEPVQLSALTQSLDRMIATDLKEKYQSFSHPMTVELERV